MTTDLIVATSTAGSTGFAMWSSNPAFIERTASSGRAYAVTAMAVSRSPRHPRPPETAASRYRLLSFCDALFVDNGCRALWEKVPRKYRPPCKARLFSYDTREQVLAYLQEIEDGGDPAVLACVRDVYGEPRAFLTMYEYERRQKAAEADREDERP